MVFNKLICIEGRVAAANGMQTNATRKGVVIAELENHNQILEQLTHRRTVCDAVQHEIRTALELRVFSVLMEQERQLRWNPGSGDGQMSQATLR
jgi:hypothetical protein